ncbi:hypothetical protein DRP07_01840 [Archaeoglobales archaeon]|nr:MAG: hypothetical protein DRP07_01840 [Archaeoglobales archaeon]
MEGIRRVYFWDSDIDWNQIQYDQEIRVYFNAPEVEGHTFSKFVPNIYDGSAFTVEGNTLEEYDIGFYAKAQEDVWETGFLRDLPLSSSRESSSSEIEVFGY